MKIKFITCIYSDLYGTDLGGRPSRHHHYRFSLLSLLKMSDADFLCYTSETELESLKDFFYNHNNISPNKLELKVFDITKTKFSDIIGLYKNVDEVRKSDRCYEIQYSKFHWWWEENSSYDYYYWIDAGLSHCGIIPDKYLINNDSTSRYYISTLFNNKFLKNLIEFSNQKFFLLSKENVRNYWSYTVNEKWYNNFDMSRHIIGGLFGGHKSVWENVVKLFERYVVDITTDEKKLYFEENILSLMYVNHPEIFVSKDFDVWWHEDNYKNYPDNFFVENKSFYKILEELNA